MTVLIVDDQPSVVKGLFSGVNWEEIGVRQISKAYSAMEAKREFDRQPIDVMLCDIEMPGESGLSLLSWVRERGYSTKCIFLTSHAEFKYAKQAVALGGFDYILQPARYEEIQNALAKALNEARQEQEQQEYIAVGKAIYYRRDDVIGSMLRNLLLGDKREAAASAHAGDGISTVAKSNWLELLVGGQGKQLEREAKQWLDQLARRRSVNAHSLRAFFQDFLQIADRAASELGIEADVLSQGSNHRWNAATVCSSLDSMKAFIEHTVRFFADYSGSFQNSAEHVDNIIAYIQDHIDQNISRTDISDSVFLNPDYVSRMFKKRTGKSLKEYIIEQKMTAARRLLLTTEMPVSMVAMQVGYSNFSHFSQAYKKVMGVNPNAERKQDVHYSR